MFARFQSHKDVPEKPEETRDNGLTLLTTPNLDLCLRTPASLEDIVSYGQLIMEGKGLLLCLNDLAEPNKVRAQDYLAGVAYTIGATETEVSPEVTMYLPGEVNTIHE
ncbi:cell division protein SepF [Acidaminococcus timonensis]|uniref:cell division protein SepF n=1 Tax=Acidaminococcus timonensis TaxID=1871002 RepID=UPI00307FECE3